MPGVLELALGMPILINLPFYVHTGCSLVRGIFLWCIQVDVSHYC